MIEQHFLTESQTHCGHQSKANRGELAFVGAGSSVASPRVDARLRGALKQYLRSVRRSLVRFARFTQQLQRRNVWVCNSDWKMAAAKHHFFTRALSLFAFQTRNQAAYAGMLAALSTFACGVADKLPDAAANVPWSNRPPGGLEPHEVPQFVAITSDDNYDYDPDSVGGLKAYIALMKNMRNADGSPARGTFYHTTLYLPNNQGSWRAGFADGHEAGDHTVEHKNGGVSDVPGMSRDECCKPRNFSPAQWREEIGAARTALTGPSGIGAQVPDIQGFRAPFLGYNDALFTTLSELGFTYDTSVPNCFADGENGTNCSWPHTLDQPSPDAEAMFATFQWALVGRHPGLWEVAPTTLVIPDDSMAEKYEFAAGLRARVELEQQVQGTLPYPSVYHAATGRAAGLDYSLLMDLKVAPSEMLAIYKYNLDLHLTGNRSPLILLSHSFMYLFEGENLANTPSLEIQQERWAALAAFIEYANSKSEVRLRPVRDILEWMQNPIKLE